MLTAAPNMAYNIVGKYAGLVSEADFSNLRNFDPTLNGGEPVDCDGQPTVRRPDGQVRTGPRAHWRRPTVWPNPTVRWRFPRPVAGLRSDEIHIVPTDDGVSTSASMAVLGEAIPGMEIRIAPHELVRGRRCLRPRGRRGGDPRHLDDERLPG